MLAGRRRRVLIVEDDEATRCGVRDLVSSEGFDTEAVADGSQALDVLRAGTAPDLILLDLSMPIMTGWEFRREQLEDAALSGIPVVIMTAHDEYGPSVAELNAAGHLQKPVRPEELQGVLNRFR